MLHPDRQCTSPSLCIGRAAVVTPRAAAHARASSDCRERVGRLNGQRADPLANTSSAGDVEAPRVQHHTLKRQRAFRG